MFEFTTEELIAFRNSFPKELREMPALKLKALIAMAQDELMMRGAETAVRETDEVLNNLQTAVEHQIAVARDLEGERSCIR